MPDSETPTPSNETALARQLRLLREGCMHCGKCQRQCALLKRLGSPGRIAEAVAQGDDLSAAAYECSLCGLCDAVCPTQVSPREMFLELRRDAVRRGTGISPTHSRVLNYERRGTSPRYSWYGLPEGCDTVLFPGCTLAGTRPAAVRRLFSMLAEHVPALGIVLDCCAKPSHDLGRDEAFHAMFDDMRDWLVERGVRRVLTACPSCQAMFERYGNALRPQTVYELLTQNLPSEAPETRARVTVHDPCVLRHDEAAQAAVRELVRRTGCELTEMQHNGPHTLCCGEGGAACLVAPDLALEWARRRTAEADGLPMITSCAGCVNRLAPHGPTMHVLDLVLDPQRTLAGRARIARAPLTYLNRLLLKRFFRKTLVVRDMRTRLQRG
ncbi:Fe-S oxidoreductase [Desulfobaculum xiamenense]|uniref:Fe-S oxidoreductase n=1 Tax=Desulfobaculum xiamenense TaxID=995050 RepID=A0A846QUT6_9BACT|nr:(Fe-S)-binding protein [Desulfobaculum xiamenense]NJB68894.1 Fe-S oxidoreductase [Desulfobaculum xiamenense]